MSFLFVDQGNAIGLARPIASRVIDHLPAKVYTIEVSKEGVSLTPLRDRFVLPEKIYGTEHSERLKLVVDDYRNSQHSIGVMMVGDKGSGKSLLAEAIANKLIQMDVPALYIDKVYPPEILAEIIRSIGPCTVIFEEFAKIYRAADADGPSNQQRLLSLFSDSSLSKVLFLLTDNSTRDIDGHFMERPGRVKYLFRFYSPSYEIFEDVAKGLPLYDEVKDYLKQYFDFHELASYYGMDVVEAIRDIAVNTSTVEALNEKMQYLNVPRPVSFVYEVVQLIDYESSKDVSFVSKKSSYDHEESFFHLEIFYKSLSGGKEVFRFEREDLVFVSDDTKTSEPGPTKHTYLIELSDRFTAVISAEMTVSDRVSTKYRKRYAVNGSGNMLKGRDAAMMKLKTSKAHASGREPAESEAERA